METKTNENTAPNAPLMPEVRDVVFAQTFDPNMIVGVISNSEPSSLALLAAGVAGMAARQARRERTKSK